MSLLSPEEIERALVNQGVPLARARAVASGGSGVLPPRTIPANAHTFTRPELPPPSIVWPFRLTLPWSYLVSDNCRYAAGTERTGGGLLLTSNYRRCRGLIRDLVRNTLGLPAPDPASIPLEVTAAIWVPDNRPHDCTNFAKVCHDAMEKLIYTNDRWIHSAHWTRAGVCVDRPRAELVIRPLL